MANLFIKQARNNEYTILLTSGKKIKRLGWLKSEKTNRQRH